MDGSRASRLMLASTLLFLGCAPGAAQEVVREAVPLPVGAVELQTMVVRPDLEGRHPVVLIRSPYSGPGSSLEWLIEGLTPHGYAVVVQSVRGTGGSTGEFRPFIHDSADGAATLDWLAAQPWAGRIGVWGISYLGWTAYAAAGHPAVSAMAVGSGWAELDHFLAPGGAFHLMAHVPWFIGFGPGGRGLPPVEALHQIFRTVPLNTLFGGEDEALEELIARGYDWPAADVPALHWTGWYDYIYRDVLRGYAALTGLPDHASDQRLIIGPWAHNDELTGRTRVGPEDFGPAAAAGLDSVLVWTRRFFDAHLRDRPVRMPPVRVFFLGENRWRTFERWPPRGARPFVLHLTPTGLDAEPPDRPSTLEFRYDPNDPVPTVGGVLSHFFPEEIGPLDQRPLDARADILRFESASLESDLVLAGPIRARLTIETAAPTTDVTAKLVRVLPNGRAEIIEDGIRRLEAAGAGRREVVIELGQRAWRIPAGSRLRLDVSGGNFPKFDRNPNTGEDPFTAVAFEPVTLRLHVGGASRLELTVLEESGGR